MHQTRYTCIARETNESCKDPFRLVSAQIMFIRAQFPRSRVQSYTCASHFTFIEFVWVLAPKKCDLRDDLLLARSNMCSLAPHNLACTICVSHMSSFGSSFEELGHRVQRFGVNLTLKSHRSDIMSLTYKFSPRSMKKKNTWGFCTLLELFSLT